MITPPTNLVASWLAAETAVKGRTEQDAVDDLNAALGTHYPITHVRRWMTGDRALPAHVLREMNEEHVLSHILSRILTPRLGHALTATVLLALTADDWRTLRAALYPPERDAPIKGGAR